MNGWERVGSKLMRVGALAAAGVMTLLPAAASTTARGVVPVSDGACRRAMSWPLRHVEQTRGFDPPERPWLAGHRGVDLAAGEHDELIAPADGVVSFVGEVAGKQVVSIRHRDLTLTFEPAVTGLSVGARVTRDQPFGEVGLGSDHCIGTCLHWGVKRGDAYLDPQAMAEPRRIVLKPAA